MNCLQCAGEIPESFFTQLGRSESFKGGRFSCPHCGAEHVRRVLGYDPSGEPFYGHRRWGHLKADRQPVAAGASDRRKTPRLKRWR